MNYMAALVMTNSRDVSSDARHEVLRMILPYCLLQKHRCACTLHVQVL